MSYKHRRAGKLMKKLRNATLSLNFLWYLKTFLVVYLFLWRCTLQHFSITIINIIIIIIITTITKVFHMTGLQIAKLWSPR